jgi:NIPSNAP protein
MHYDVTTLVLRPGTTPKALPRLEQWLRETPLGGKLLACWFSEIGALNRILLIREYGDEPEISVDRGLIMNGGNPYGVADLIGTMSSDTYAPFPFMPPMPIGSFGPFFEVRSYLLQTAGLAKTIELWQAAVPDRARLSPLLAAMYSLSGGLPRFMHIWPYASLDQRQSLRSEAVRTGVWPPPGGPDQLRAQQADIYLAAGFSPIR